MSAKRSKPGTGNMAMLSAATSRLSSMVAREDHRTLREVPVAAIRPNPHQPRTYFDEESLKSLAASIDKMGLIQPVCVQEIALNEFQLIAGERRVRAHRILGRETILSLVFPHDADPALLAQVENAHRQDLTPFDLVMSVRALHEEHKVSHEVLADVIGKSQSYVSRVLAISQLPSSILEEARVAPDVGITRLMIVAEADAEDQARLWELAKAGESIRALKDAKKQPEVQHPERDTSQRQEPGSKPTPFHTAAANISKGLDRITKLKGKAGALGQDDQAVLRELRAKIDALLS